MTVAQRALTNASRVTLCWKEIPFLLMSGDVVSLTIPGVNIHTVAARLVATEAVTSLYPQGMPRSDGSKWAVWQELLLQDMAETTKELVSWLRDKLDTGRTQPGFSQWRELLIDYLDTRPGDADPNG